MNRSLAWRSSLVALALPFLCTLLLCAACGANTEPTVAEGGGHVRAQRQALTADGFAYGEVLRVANTAHGAGDLTDFQVQVKLNTAAEITAGRMRSDCADLRVYSGNGCTAGTPASFWVADGTCNTTSTSVWLGLPSLLAGSFTSFAIYWGDPNATSLSNGAAVFPIFFDDFNDDTIDPNKWSMHGPEKLTEGGGTITTSGGAAAIWTKQKVMAQGQTVFGVGTNAQSAFGVDIEYGASTMIEPGSPSDIHWSARTYTGATFLAFDETMAFIGGGTHPGQCEAVSAGARWTNAPGDSTWFQTEFFYEWVGDHQTRFGIYDKLGIKREVTLGDDSCTTPATESAYFQWDQLDSEPNPISSLDYAYVRKYATPEPLISDRIKLAQAQCKANGTGPCSVSTATAHCASGACSNAAICIPSREEACYVDSDCSSAQFCNRTEMACKARLAVGAQLPADGLHNTCPSNDANAACATGLCNANTASCAARNGARCDAPNDCVVNVCGSDDLCGYASAGSCTEQTAEVCRASCGESGVCLPPDGCDDDDDCEAEQHCDLAALGCVPDLINGAVIPADHGSCGGSRGSAGPALAVCRSEHCNELSNTCAAVNGNTCTTAAGCESGVCESDFKCGYPDGTGSCSVSTQATVCRSQHCSAHGGKCVPSADSCWVDADCASDQFCHRDSFTCTDKLAAGQALPTDDLHDACTAWVSSACATGLCNRQTSTCAQANGESCSAVAECVSNACDNDGKCGYTNGAGTCEVEEAAPQCRSGICGSSDVCIPSGGCAVDSDCESGEYCVVADLQCAPALANGFPLPPGHGTCSNPGSAGSAETACASGACNPGTNTCAGASGNTTCTSASECAVNLCGANGLCGLHQGQSGCDENNQADVCQSDTCSISTGVCIPAGLGRCWVDGDCSGSEYCHRTSFLCMRRLPAGSELPGDNLHNACPLSELNGACASGACNRVTSTCALDFLSACEGPSECVSNVCDEDDKCGYANGNGPCSADTQESACRSGICNDTGRCIPADGCVDDSECSESRFCRAADFACALKLSNGSALPEGHGSCGGSGALGHATHGCASGACNSETGTCAGPNSETECGVDAECINNVCGNNDLCGHADGVGSTCTTENAGTQCQSGVCSTHGGKCLPEGADKCWVDQDCAEGDYCHRASFTCEAQLVSGSLLPADGLHTSCNEQGTSRACVTGLCDSASQRCVALNGVGCDAADACLSQVCGSNGQCGYDVGQGPCSVDDAESVCQSGVCASSGACIPSGENRCWLDADCIPGDYCDRESRTCHARIAAGEPVPNDGLHMGCSDGTSDACSTGLCSNESDLCVASNNISCDDNDACASAICGGNGICGRADGEGPCSEDDATANCQSGKCGASKVCISGDCWNDSDCPEGNYCYRAQQACRAPVAAGEPVPDDEVHSGCSDGTNSACSSGLCNADTGLCVGTNSTNCEIRDVCASGICGANSLCGHANGEGPCTDGDAADKCQSSKCSPHSAVCVTGECWLDLDCAEGSYCDRSEQTCRERIGAGSPAPNDGLHEGCVDGASEACSGGLCNADSGLCVASNNISCESSDACASAICGGNGLCGHADGEGPCSDDDAATSCQSGKCSPHAEVCMFGECWVDDDCGSTAYCQRSTQTCELKLYSGAPLPDDGVHAICEDGESEACMSGHCENGRCVEQTQALGLSGGGGCSTTGATADGSFLLLALLWLRRGRRRSRLLPGSRRLPFDAVSLRLTLSDGGDLLGRGGAGIGAQGELDAIIERAVG